jgi:hypothetical protein
LNLKTTKEEGGLILLLGVRFTHSREKKKKKKKKKKEETKKKTQQNNVVERAYGETQRGEMK